MTVKKTKAQIQEEEEEKKNAILGYQYSHGYLQGLLDSSWTCIDCGNTYDAVIDECPNRNLDEGNAHVRAAKHKLDYFGVLNDFI